MKKPSQTEKQRGRYLPWAVGSVAFIGLVGTLFAISEVLENDTKRMLLRAVSFTGGVGVGLLGGIP